MSVFHGSHHFANTLAKATGSKVQTADGHRHYKVSTDKSLDLVDEILIKAGFTMQDSVKDEECIERQYTLEQNHHVASAVHQTAFLIKFDDEPSLSVFFSQSSQPAYRITGR